MQLIKDFCILIVCFLLIGCSSGMQLYYIKEARVITYPGDVQEPFVENRSESVKRLLNGHYVKSGDSLVLLVRRFDKGHFFSVDDETYEKLTIEIRDYTIGTPMKLNSPNVHFYYSSGNSGFVSKGHGVYSFFGSGDIVVKKVERNIIVVELDLEILTEPAGSFPFEGRKVQMKDSFSFKEKKLTELSSWLGVPDPSLGKEVYP